MELVVTAPAIGAGLAATRAADTARAPASDTARFPLFAINTQNLLEGATRPKVGHATLGTSQNAGWIARAGIPMGPPRGGAGTTPERGAVGRRSRFLRVY